MRKKTGQTFVFYLALIATCGLVIFPAYWMVMTSLTKRTSLLTNSSAFPPLENLSLDAYLRIFQERPLAIWIKNSVVITILTILLVIVISTLAAYSLSRYRFRSNRAIGYALLLACMLPPTLIIIPLYIIFSKLSIVNSFLSVILANTAITVPFATWMMKGFFDGIPVSLEEAAQIDGCGILSSIVRIVLPLSLPGLATTVIYVAVLSWSDFLFARTFLLEESKWTMTTGVYSMIGEHLIMWEEICAVSVLSIIPITILFMFFQKYLVKGMALGAVKQ